MPHESDVNYSIGVLVILLMMFWFVCKCIGKQQNSNYRHRPIIYMRHPPIQLKQPMKDVPNIKSGGMIYGGTKIKIGNSDGSSQIKLNKGTVEVPNSKTAMRDLMSNDISLSSDSSKDTDLSTMHMQKKNKEKFKNHPHSLTNERGLRSDSFNDLKPMKSY